MLLGTWGKFGISSKLEVEFMVITCKVFDDNKILVLVEDTTKENSEEHGNMQLTGWGDHLKGKLKVASDKVIDKLSSLIPFIANKLRATVDQIAVKPSELSCEMGIEFTGEESIFVIKATETADIKITFTWKNL